VFTVWYSLGPYIKQKRFVFRVNGNLILTEILKLIDSKLVANRFLSLKGLKKIISTIFVYMIWKYLLNVCRTRI
jgi:hypothetical protein